MIRPRIVAHRGGGALAPENTLAAIRRAVALGADMVEVDVQRTRDGHLVAHHDETLDRTAGVARRVDDLELSELRALDVGRWFAREFTGERVPTLEDIAAALPASAGLLMDLKHGDERWPGLSRQIAEFAGALGPARAAVMSIRHDLAAHVAAAAPGVLALYTYRAPLATDPEIQALHELPPGIGFGVSLRALSAAMLVVAREDGRPVYTFTPNTAAELEVALTVGADAVITDRPDLALDLRSAASRT